MISIKNSYIFGWEVFKKRWKLFLAICLVLFATSLLSGANNAFLPIVRSKALFVGITIFFWVLYLILNAFLNAGFKKMLLSLRQGSRVQFTDIIAPKKDALRYFLGQLVIFAAIFVAMLVALVLVSGLARAGISPFASQMVIILALFVVIVFLASRFGFWAFAMFDKNLTPLKGFTESKKVTKGHTWSIVLFFIVSGLVAGIALIIVALVPFLNFVLILIALYMIVSLMSLASVDLYRQMTNLSTGASIPTEEKDTETAPLEVETSGDSE